MRSTTPAADEGCARRAFIGEGTVAIEVPHVRSGDRGQLIDDHIRARSRAPATKTLISRRARFGCREPPSAFQASASDKYCERSVGVLGRSVGALVAVVELSLASAILSEEQADLLCLLMKRGRSFEQHGAS